MCHSAFGFYQSGFNHASILTIDGHGENETCFLGEVKNKKINKITSIQYPHSVGLFYGTFTDFLGFKADSDEWKVMALSSHDKNNHFDKKIGKIYSFYNDKFEMNCLLLFILLIDKKTFSQKNLLNYLVHHEKK